MPRATRSGMRVDVFMLLCFYAHMSTRLTVDLGDQQLVRLVRMEAARESTSIRDVVVRALQAYLSGRRENQALAKLADPAFEEWYNPEDAAYDGL